MSNGAWSVILWDVDGTIADASAGILPRLRTVLSEFGRTPPDPADMAHWIGPPMFETFQLRGMMDESEATRAVARYRQLAAADGYAESVRLYPGIPELVRSLHDAGMVQSTASTKPENQVRAILSHFRIDHCFTAITGAHAEAGAFDTKADVLARALARLESAGVDVSRPVLIGDRHHDVDGASALDVPVIFVRWGFGSPGEEDGAIAVVDSVDELRMLLLPTND